MSSRPRAATAETSEPSDLIELPLRALRGIGDGHRAVAAAIEAFRKERLLRAIGQEGLLMQAFTPGQRLELMGRFTAHDIEPDTIILREGEVPEGLYVVLLGELEAMKGTEPFETQLGRWAPGDMGCEGWLLRSSASPVTLRATLPTTVLLLTRDSFQRVCGAVPAAQKEIDRILAQHGRELGRLGRSVLPAPGGTGGTDDEPLA